MSAADEQAREVEVRLVGEAIEDAAMRLKGRDLGTVHRDQIAREALAALEPVRAAERQEAAREALLAAADEVEGIGWGYPWSVDYSSAVADSVKILRDRADGVTGRGEGCEPVEHVRCMCNTPGCGCRLTEPPSHFHDDGRRYLGAHHRAGLDTTRDQP